MIITTDMLLALTPLLSIALTVLVVMLTIAWRRSPTLTVILTTIGLLISLISLLSFVIVFAFLQDLAIGTLLIMNLSTVIFGSMVILSAIAISVFANDWLKAYPDNKEEFYLLLLVSTLGGLLLCYASHMTTLYLGIEMLSMPIFGLVGYSYRRKRSLEAGIKYMVMSATASSFMLLGIALLYAVSGNLAFSTIGTIKVLGEPVFLAGMGLLIIGIAFKLSLVPFHFWTPDVYEGASASASSFLATVGKVGVLCVFMHVLQAFHEPSPMHYQIINILLFLFALCSIFFGNILAIRQDNIKRMLGYSSISHLGYIIIIFIYLIDETDVVSNLYREQTLYIYTFGYVLASLVSFGVITLVSSPYTEEDQDNIHQYRGLFWRQPLLATSLLIALLSLAGIPLTIGFIGKFFLITLAAKYALWLLLAIIIIGSGLGLYYYLRLAVTLFRREESLDQQVTDKQGRYSWCSGLMLIVCNFLILLFGIYPDSYIVFAQTLALFW